MSITNRRSRFAIATICAFSLVAAACGGDDEETGADTAAESESSSAEATAAPATTAAEETPPTTAGDEAPATTAAETPATTAAEEVAAPTGTPIKIGLVYSETGRTALTYGMTDGVANAWAEWVNTEMGGVNGHPVEIVAVDGQSTGEGAVSAANDLLAEGVVGIVVQDTTAENAIAETITAAGIPMIGGTSNGRPSDTGDAHWPNSYFPISTSNPASASGPMAATAAAGLTNFSAAVCAEVPACAEAGGLYDAIAPAFGIEYVGLVTVGAADPSYTAPCLELIGNGAAVINLGLAPQTALAVIDECSLQGYEGAFSAANNSITAPDFENIEGLRLIGSLNGFPWWADAEPAQLYRDVQEQYGDGDDVRNSSATTTWAALELFRKAMGESGPAADADVTASDVIGVYQGISGETLDGLLPQPISYVADGFQPAVSCFWLFDMQGGEFASVSSGESGNGVEGDLQTTCFSLG
jgi:branched-chain amino acid transport system substrate-binding protein